MIESYKVDKARGVVPMEFADIEDGSWIVSYYIDNEELWDAVKNTDVLNGVSVQGLFNLKEKVEMAEQIDPIESLIDEILNESNKLK